MTEEKAEQLPFYEPDSKKEERKPEGEKKYEKPPKLRTVCSISCSMSARDFIGLLKKEGVKAVLDTRVSRNYRGTGFQTSEDDFRFLCEASNIDYYVVGTLAPTTEMRQRLADTFKEVKSAADRDPKAWTTFLESYGNLLRERKPSRNPPLANIINGDYEAIAIVCACRHHDDCHRSMACGLMTTLFPDVGLKILYSGKEPPPRASPRRYRLKDFPWAGLKAESSGGRK